LLFNILRRVRVNPNSNKNTEKQESDGGAYYCCAINVHRNNMDRNVKMARIIFVENSQWRQKIGVARYSKTKDAQN